MWWRGAPPLRSAVPAYATDVCIGTIAMVAQQCVLSISGFYRSIAPSRLLKCTTFGQCPVCLNPTGARRARAEPRLLALSVDYSGPPHYKIMVALPCISLAPIAKKNFRANPHAGGKAKSPLFISAFQRNSTLSPFPLRCAVGLAGKGGNVATLTLVPG